VLVEKAKKFGRLERRVTHFERERVGVERAEEGVELVARLFRVFEAPRVLEQHRAEAVRIHHRIEVAAEGAHVRGDEIRLLVREIAIHLRRELEMRIARHAAHPARGMRRRRDAVEGRVDLDRVEETGQIPERIELRAVRRIDRSFPVLVAPAGRSDAEFVSAHRERQHLDIFICNDRKRLRRLGNLC
jgi:hypothetical protein